MAEQTTIEQVKTQAGEIATQTMEKVEKLGEQAKAEVTAALDQNAKAKELTAGLLQPIYQLAESLSFPAFHWLAFAIMFAGVVGFALQIVLAKLLVLSQASFSLSEIISDFFGLFISLIGLVLTTQAATEHSTFTQSPAAVLTSAGVGLVIGVILYFWGQAQEMDAARGRDGTH
jgi:glucan phosphoethanolaminetransferase (alkaline phosphatase superfamily)